MKIVRPLAALALATMLTGCAANAATESAATLTPDEQYVLAVHQSAPESMSTEDDVLIEAGQTICLGFDGGLTLDQIGVAAAQSDMSMELAGSMAGAAVAIYCPEHTDVITNA